MAEKGMFNFDVRPDGEDEFRLVATSRDVSLWERTHKGRSLKMIEQSYSMSLMEELAHVACRRQRRWEGSLAELRERCDIEVIDTSKDALRELLDRAVAEDVITDEQAEAIAAFDAEPGEIETLDPTRPGR
jgi:hypothetical protein